MGYNESMTYVIIESLIHSYNIPAKIALYNKSSTMSSMYSAIIVYNILFHNYRSILRYIYYYTMISSGSVGVLAKFTVNNLECERDTTLLGINGRSLKLPFRYRSA